jgi:integrase
MRRPPTVEELFEEFLTFSATRGRAPTTLREYRNVFDRFFLPSIGKIPIQSLTSFDLDVLYTEAMRRDLPFASTTIKKYHAVISVALGQAVKWGWIPANPARSVSIPHVPLIHRTLPTPEEVARLIRECTDCDPQLGAFVLLGAITGCRRGELAGLRWSDVQEHQILVRRSIYVLDGAVHVKSTKSGRERSVGVGPRLKDLLKNGSAPMRRSRGVTAGGSRVSRTYSPTTPSGAAP